MKEKISQVIVVEGRDDTVNLKRYFDVETYETRGSAINDQDIERIQRLHQRHGFIVFTDLLQFHLKDGKRLSNL